MRAMSENLKSGGFQNVHDVCGIGDEAFWGSRSAMGELSVRKGKSILIAAKALPKA
jgi:hypothetical protein